MEPLKNKGFEISFDPAQWILRARLWGFWDEEFGKQYDRAFTEKVAEFCSQGKEWYALLDLSEFHLCSLDVQDILLQNLRDATEQGMRKVAYLGSISAAQIHLHALLLILDLPYSAFAESEEEALQWLLDESSPQKYKEPSEQSAVV
jgi:hypothetical protein